jgi:putative hydrolase of the HAD superfamily
MWKDKNSMTGFDRVQAILFDLGGTLDGEGMHWLDRFYSLYEESGLSIARERIKEAFYYADQICCTDTEINSLGLRSLMNIHVSIQAEVLGLKEMSFRQELAEKFCSDIEAHFRRNLPILQRLRSTYRLGVITNYYGNAEVVLEEAGFRSILDVILDSVQVGLSKPDQALFIMALSRLGISAERTVFVGDSYERDMVPAHLLGMKTIWIPGPCPRFTPEPGVISAAIEKLDELEQLL